MLCRLGLTIELAGSVQSVSEAGVECLLPENLRAGVHFLRAAEAKVLVHLAEAHAARLGLLPADEGVPSEVDTREEG